VGISFGDGETQWKILMEVFVCFWMAVEVSGTDSVTEL
jgi:hypothetical protein